MAEQSKKTQAEKAVAVAKSKKDNQTKRTSNKKELPPEPPKERVIPVRFITSAIFLALFFLFLAVLFDSEGLVMRIVKNIVMGFVGKVGFVISIPVLLYLFIIHAFSGNRPVLMRSVCLGVFVLAAGAVSHLILGYEVGENGFALIGELYTSGVNGIGGGLLCGAIGTALKGLFGTGFSYLVLGVAALFVLLGAMQITVPSIVRAIRNRPRGDWEDEERPARQEPAAVVVNHIATKRIEHVQHRRALAEQAAEQPPKRKQKKESREENAASIIREIEPDTELPVIGSGNQEALPEPAAVSVEEPARKPKRKRKESVVPEEPVPLVEAPVDAGPEILTERMPELNPDEPIPPAPQIVRPRKVTAKEADASAAQVAEEIAQAAAEPVAEYCFPPIDLLTMPSDAMADGTSEMRENTRRLNETLESFHIEAHIVNVTRGPSVTRYEVELEKGVRLSKLTSAADDIALSLGASGVRIAAVPGRISVVGIEVPNRNVNTVYLREVIDSPEFAKAKSKSTFAVGKDIGGNCIVGNIAKLPHMLIAGTTGSGKSVCMNTIIVSLLYKASPDEVKLIMVDPKMVELGIYNGIPHLLIPVVTDPKKAAGSLQWAVTEMMRRYKSMSDAGVRDLASYNEIMAREGNQKLPQVVVIIDELADLMLVAAKEVEESICRIAQMGRAAGMHLLIATQRPSADVITGLMKANIPSRIAFAVASAMESRIILDTQGAEKLVGKGDMLFAPIGSGKPKRVQGCFVSDEEVEAVTSYVKNNYATTYDQQVMEEIEKKAAQTGSKGSANQEPEPEGEEFEGDEMLPAAVEVILETGQASVSMLQRRLKLGYARAARIVDEMEERGYVGPFQGSKPRAILITKEQWEMQKNNGSQMNFEDLPLDEEAEETPVQ